MFTLRGKRKTDTRDFRQSCLPGWATRRSSIASHHWNRRAVRPRHALQTFALGTAVAAETSPVCDTFLSFDAFYFNLKISFFLLLRKSDRESPRSVSSICSSPVSEMGVAVAERDKQSDPLNVAARNLRIALQNNINTPDQMSFSIYAFLLFIFFQRFYPKTHAFHFSMLFPKIWCVIFWLKKRAKKSLFYFLLIRWFLCHAQHFLETCQNNNLLIVGWKLKKSNTS